MMVINEKFLEPVAEDNPCGPDLRWDPAFIELDQMLQAAKTANDVAAVDAETVAGDAATFEEIIRNAEKLLKRTKDIRVFLIYAEARWYDEGLGGFAESIEDTVSAIETWADHNEGIHPRADPEDGDLGERVAPIGKILNLMPNMANTVGWGDRPEISRRLEIVELLKSVFDAWEERLSEAFGRDLPSCRQAWASLSGLISAETGGEAVDDGGRGAAGGGVAAGGMRLPDGDSWDLLERAAELMVHQDRHSPALPVLRMLSSWRSVSLMEIADGMKTSGVSLEQLLESIRRQLEPRN